MRASYIQANVLWENIPGNLNYFEHQIDSIGYESDIIVLPEMFSTGFSMNIHLAEEVPGKTSDWMSRMAIKYDCCIIGSIIARHETNYYNRLIFVTPDGSVGHYDKKHLFGYGNENEYYTAGLKRVVFNWNGWSICPLICYDLRFPVWSRNTEPFYDLLIFIASWPAVRQQAWKSLLNARAIENQSYVIGVNRIGMDGNGLEYNGHSVFLNYLGETMNIPSELEHKTTVVLDHQKLYEFRSRYPFLQDGDQFALS